MHQRASSASGAQEVDEKIEDLRVQDRWGFEMLAGGRSPGKNENARADDRADAERSQRPRAQRLAQAMFGLVGLGDEFVDRFTTQELAAIGLSGRVGRE